MLKEQHYIDVRGDVLWTPHDTKSRLNIASVMNKEPDDVAKTETDSQ